MKKSIKFLFCFVLLWAQFICSSAPADTPTDLLPSFPGAEGFGSTTPGGRGGRVIKVTNLNTSGPGSLQQACSEEGPRIVVFDTSGVIPGEISIKHGRITIMGQTAPGAGITIKGMLSTPWDETGQARYEDIVIRFLRIRPDPIPDVAWADAIQFSGVHRCVLDHVSCSWASDETVDIFSTDSITIQWCTIEESDKTGHPEGAHNYGLISGPEGGHLSIHHTLFAHHMRRCPAIANGPSDVRNLVVYNFRDGFLHDNESNNGGFNIIGNYYKRGYSNDPDIRPFCFADEYSYYLRDNYIEGIGLIQDPWAEKDKLRGLELYAGYGVKAEEEFEVPAVTTHSPEEAYELVLTSAGCFPRDTVSRRTIEEVRSGTGSWGRHESGDLMTGLSYSRPAVDSDSDGMSDVWEKAQGLEPGDSSDYNTVLASGYTAIEEYCNMLAEKLIATQGKSPVELYDFNGDEELGIADVISLVLRGLQDPADPLHDLNLDGRFTVSDAISLLLLIRDN
jgi:pectate lyase